MENNFEREMLDRSLGLEDINYDETVEITVNESESDKVAAEENTEKKNLNSGESSKLDLYDFVQCIVSALVVGILIFIFVFRVIGVKGGSMYSTLHNGDRIVATGVLYDPEVGDIIILKSSYYDQPLVKRIIAVENQTVDIDFSTGTVYVDGEVIDEPYIYEATYVDEGFDGPVTVPEGHVFVMGDNRNESNDSRSPTIGFIDEREIFGKVFWILFPTDGNGGYDWSRFGAVK